MCGVQCQCHARSGCTASYTPPRLGSTDGRGPLSALAHALSPSHSVADSLAAPCSHRIPCNEETSRTRPVPASPTLPLSIQASAPIPPTLPPSQRLMRQTCEHLHLLTELYRSCRSASAVHAAAHAATECWSEAPLLAHHPLSRRPRLVAPKAHHKPSSSPRLETETRRPAPRAFRNVREEHGTRHWTGVLTRAATATNERPHSAANDTAILLGVKVQLPPSPTHRVGARGTPARQQAGASTTTSNNKSATLGGAAAVAATTAAATDHRTAGRCLRRSIGTGEPPSPLLPLQRRPPRPTSLAEDVSGAPRTVGRTGVRRRGAPTAATPPLLITLRRTH